MKKFLVVLLVIVCLAGVGFLGYTVFRSKNITKVEIDGQIQTLYLVNETTTPDFQDAKLRVTYKNGTSKNIELDSKSVKINDFSTSIETHGVMKIIYKSETIEVPYNVIKTGMYYRQSDELKSTEGTEFHTIGSIAEIDFMFSLEPNGKVKFYNKQSGDWYLKDGNYNSDYSYSVSGDTVKVNLGSQVFNIKASYVDGAIEIFSKSFTYKNDIVQTEHTYIFKNIQGAVQSGQIDTASVSKDKSTIYETDSTNGEPVFMFNKNESIKSSGNSIYLEVNYKNNLINVVETDGSTINFINKVYVEVTDEMVPRLKTSNVYTTEILSAYILYDGYKQETGGIVMEYKVSQD